MGCVRRSILPENLHFDKDLNLKLAHFASAVDLDQGPAPCASASVVDYLAPEVMSYHFILFLSTWQFGVLGGSCDFSWPESTGSLISSVMIVCIAHHYHVQSFPILCIVTVHYYDAECRCHENQYTVSLMLWLIRRRMVVV